MRAHRHQQPRLHCYDFLGDAGSGDVAARDAQLGGASTHTEKGINPYRLERSIEHLTSLPRLITRMET